MSIPAMIFSLVILLAGLGTWRWTHDWKDLVHAQLRVDRCVQGATAEMKETMNQLRQRDREIQMIRSALLPANLAPPVRAALQTALQIAVGVQVFLLVKWKIAQTRWLLPPCGDRFLPLPGIPAHRPPPDGIGSRPLSWDTKINPIIFVSKKNRRSTAHLFFDSQWKAKWIADKF